MKRIVSAVLAFVLLLGVCPALTPDAKAAEYKLNEPKPLEQLELVYEVNFNGDSIYQPKGISGNYTRYSYTPSADGKSLNIKGCQYDDPTATNGDTGATYWGGTFKGMEVNALSQYTFTFKVNNHSTKANSQIGVAGWINGLSDGMNWNITSNFNTKVGNTIATLFQGNTTTNTAANDTGKDNLRNADVDADGFIDIMIEYDGYSNFGKYIVSTKRDGKWVRVNNRSMSVGGDAQLGAVFYTYRSGSINTTIKDMKLYKGVTQIIPATTPTQWHPISEKTYEVTGYETMDNIVTLAEVKTRYGIDKKLSGTGIKNQPAWLFNNDAQSIWYDYYDGAIDVYYAKMAAGTPFSLAESFSSAGYKDLYLTLSTAGDPGTVKIETTTDGKTWKDSGVACTVTKSEKEIADAVNTDGIGFGHKEKIAVYDVTSGTLPGGIKNVRITTTGGVGLVTLYVWGDNGKDIKIPLLAGNQNPTVEKSTYGGKTKYHLYSTDFSTTDSWVTNVFKYGQETMGRRTYSAFKMSGKLPTVDGRQVRLYSPDMTLDLNLYESVMVNFSALLLEEKGDIPFNFALGYSVNNGSTWSKIPVKPAVAKNGDTYTVSMDIKPALKNIGVTEITNVVILPYDGQHWYTLSPNNGDEDVHLRKAGSLPTTLTGACRMLDFSLTGISSNSNVDAKAVPVYQQHYDTIVIQEMLDSAHAAGKTEVTIPAVNPKDGSNIWVISDTITIPSNMTVYINNCKLRWEQFVYCNMITNKKAWTVMTVNDERDENIHVIGIGEAGLQGGDPNGVSTQLIASTGETTWTNSVLILHNVDGFSVKNLRSEQPRFWTIVLEYCSNGEVSGMDFHNTRPLYNTVRVCEQDSLDIRNGCSNILVNDITGRSGDDLIAFNSIRPYWLDVKGADGSTRNVVVTNVNAAMTELRMNVRLTAANGYGIYDVLIDGVRDTRTDFGGTGEFRSTGSVRLGDNTKSYASINGQTKDKIHNIMIRNVQSYGRGVFDVRHENVDDHNWMYDVNSCVANNPEFPGVVFDVPGDASLSSQEKVCTHNWGKKLTGTLHLWGLSREDAAKNWIGCYNCPAIKATEDDISYINGFTDVPSNAYFADAVKWAADLNITNGTTATTFTPHRACMHQEVVTFLWRAVGYPTPESSSPFPGYPWTHYAYEPTAWIYENGIFTSTNFPGTEGCSRGDAMLYLWRMNGAPDVDATSMPFTDVHPSEPYAKAIAWAVSKGITTGTTATTFSPEVICSRAHIVAFLQRAAKADALNAVGVELPPDVLIPLKTINFNGDADYKPGAVSGNTAGYSYTPSADGSSLHVKGNLYDDGSATDGTTGATFWGGIVKNVTIDPNTAYVMTYKVKNESTKANSQFAIGGITNNTANTRFWNITSSFNATATSILTLMNGNTNGVSGTSGLSKLRSADKDEAGFITIKMKYDCPNGALLIYTMKDGEWTQVASRTISVAADAKMGLLFYTYRTGAIDFTIKDVEISKVAK